MPPKADLLAIPPGSLIPFKARDIHKIIKDFLQDEGQEGIDQMIMRTDVRESMVRVLKGDEPSDQTQDAMWSRHGDQFRLSDSEMLLYRGRYIPSQGEMFKVFATAWIETRGDSYEALWHHVS